MCPLAGRRQGRPSRGPAQKDLVSLPFLQVSLSPASPVLVPSQQGVQLSPGGPLGPGGPGMAGPEEDRESAGQGASSGNASCLPALKTPHLPKISEISPGGPRGPGGPGGPRKSTPSVEESKQKQKAMARLFPTVLLLSHQDGLGAAIQTLIAQHPLRPHLLRWPHSEAGWAAN